MCFSETDDLPLSQLYADDVPLSQLYPSSHLNREPDVCEERDATIDAVQEAHGRFVPSDGWEVAPKPDATQQSRLDKLHVWSTRRIAHVFDDGWMEGYFRGKWGGRLENRDKYIVSYPRQGRYAHELNIGDYGASKIWVILQKTK